jgi:hypothetical protein
MPNQRFPKPGHSGESPIDSRQSREYPVESSGVDAVVGERRTVADQDIPDREKNKGIFS